jgi:multiple sugar transport system substrate-binding protein
MSDKRRKPRGMSRRSMLKLTTALAATTVGGGLLSTLGASSTASAGAPAVIRGKKLTIWFGQSFLESIDKKLGSLFQEFGKEKGVEIDFIITPSAQLPQKLAAAIQGKNPPDICYQYDSDTQYYRGQNQLVEVTDVWSELKKKGGDVYAAAEATVAWESKAWSIPMAINPWPMHSRKDLLDKAGQKYPANWEEFIETCKKIQKPPQLYGYGPCLGKNDDNNCNFIHIMWTFGAQIQTKDNKPAFNGPETRKAFQLVADMYAKHKIIPPGSINWDNAGNNNAYQSEQCAFVQNPASVLAWCQVNKPQLAEATLLANMPAGPAGSFGMVDCWAMSIFKDSKAQDAAKEALAYVMEPDRYDGFIQMAAGRYVPVFKKLTNTKFWKESKFYHTYPGLAETGRIMAFAGQPTAAFGEVLRGYILADALQAVIVQGVSVDNAVNEADKKIQAIYKKHGFI